MRWNGDCRRIATLCCGVKEMLPSNDERVAA